MEFAVRERDVVIIGAGPAGIAAAMWAHTLGLEYSVFDREGAPGGQLHRVYNRIVDYPGMVMPDGAALAGRFAEHLSELAVRIECGVSIERIDVRERTVWTAGGATRGACLILAMGVRRRTLGIPGEAEYVGRGVSPSASRYAREFAGRSVLVVGGGDAAFEEALILAEVCRHVTVVHRRDVFLARQDFRERVAGAANITVLANASLAAIEGDEAVERAIVETDRGTQAIDVAGVFVCAGVVPNTELVQGQVALDAKGFVVVGTDRRSSVEAVYAAGDVCSGSSWTIAGAVGDGAAAVKDIQRKLRQGGPLQGPDGLG